LFDPAHVLALLGVVIATVSDWRTRRVPNWLTIGMLILGLGLGVIQNGLIGLGGTLAGVFVSLALFLLPFTMGWLGGGDVKLFMSIGALLGVQAVLWVALYSAVAGGVLALILVIHRLVQSGQLLDQARLTTTSIGLWFVQQPWRLRQRTASHHPVLPSTRTALREKFPYALAIGIGTCIVVWQGYPLLW
jgi:Flp pilus assembly protein protease CpaA